MKKIILLVSFSFFALGILFIYQYFKFNDGKLHVVICDVGQGDAIFIRTPQGSDVLIDGGPDNSVLACLSNHMPFWDRTLELVILTHPHADHFMGLFSVLKAYKVNIFATEDLENKTLGFSEFRKTIKDKNGSTRFVFAGDKFRLKDGVIFEIIGPTREFLSQTSPGGTIGETSEFGSVETLIRYKDFATLLTGDSQAEELGDAVERYIVKDIDILQIPHHGSRFGLTADILDILNPKIAVISVGAKNRYGHPAPFILDLLNSKNIKTLRTDQDGEVKIVSDGKTWKVKSVFDTVF